MKLIQHVHTTVTQGDWGVSCLTGAGINGAILHIHRARIAGRELPVSKWLKGFGDGRQFPNVESAYQWAFDHGYLKLYFTARGLRDARKLRAMDQRFLVISGRGSYGGYKETHRVCNTYANAAAFVELLQSQGISDARVWRS